MSKVKFYFENVDSEICYQLEHFIDDAKAQGLKTVTILEAEEDDSMPEYVWCAFDGSTADKSCCNKKSCNAYRSKSDNGKGKCEYRGKLYSHGDEVTFDVV